MWEYNYELYHHGTKGQKWGKRNYQNEDGSYTEKGQEENNGHGRYAPNYSDKKNKTIELNMIAASVAAAIGLGIGVAYYLNIKDIDKSKFIGNNDLVIKSSDFLQRISPIGEKDLHDVFYAAVDENDKKRYSKMLELHYKMQGDNIVAIKKIGLNKDLKIAGHDTAKKVFDELANTNKLYKDFDYETFNVAINAARHDSSLQQLYSEYFNKLKSLDYDGIIDYNDQYVSGYNSRAPIIIFNKSSVHVDSMISKKINIGKAIYNYLVESKKSDDEKMIMDGENIELLSNIGSSIVLSSLAIGTIAYKISSNSTEDKFLKETTNKKEKIMEKN